MKARPVTMINTNSTSTPAKRILLRIALIIALLGTVAVSSSLLLKGGSDLLRSKDFLDVGLHSLRWSSIFLTSLGLISSITFLLLLIGTLKVNKIILLTAAFSLAFCSLALITLSVWSFLTIASESLSTSINRTIVEELDQTQFSYGTGNNVIVQNTQIMSQLEKQHHCCGLTNSVEEYRNRQNAWLTVNNGPSSSSSNINTNSNRARGSSTQRNSATFGSIIHLPISCCNEAYRSTDLCIDIFGNASDPITRYNTKGCYGFIVQDKYHRIERQGFLTIITACVSVISCIALAAVVRILNEGYQILPARLTT